LTTPTEAVDSATVGSSRAHLIGMPLLVKVMAPEGTLLVVSRVVTLAVQTLESVKTGHTSWSSPSRRVRLGISLVTPS